MVTEASKRATAKYKANNYMRIAVEMPKEEAQAIIDYCHDNGISRAGFIREVLAEAIKKPIVK